jgi:hypothetical protein
MKQKTPDAVLRPGAEGWELWKLPPKEDPTLEEAFTEKSLDAFANLLLALPSRSVLSMPLWIASQGEPAELAELELTSRHLLRKDAEVYTVPILEKEGRSLVLALAATDDETAHEYLKRAKCFEIPARLLDPVGADVLVWKEQGTLCFAIYREDQCVFFAATGDSNPGAAFCGAIARTAMRLRSESVITRMPAKLRLIGDFLEADAMSLGHALRLDFEIEKKLPAPVLPKFLSDAAPPTARAALLSRARIKRLASFATMGLAIYAVILFFVAVDLAWQRFQLHRLNNELKSIESVSTNAQNLVTEWRQFRSAIDPQAFAIDQLAAVATEIPGEQVRLTQYNYDKGRLSIAGEATDVSQAYEFFERVKKAQLLQDYDWTSRQPQLAGRNKVRFEMEGARPDAKTGEE